MKIAQISPLIESTPPQLYGGTERMVSWLTEELVRQGHEVTLFASGDSVTDATLEAFCPKALRLDPRVKETNPYYFVMLDALRRRADEFDILHFHIDYFHYPLFRDIANKTLTTLHGRQDTHDLQPLHRTFPELPLATISDSQASFVRSRNVAGTVLHGLPENLFAPNYKPKGGYLAFLGRMAPDKRPDRAIEIARKLRVPLKMAAKIDAVDQEYFDQKIEPMLKGEGVEFIGEIGEREKQDFLGNAAALLFPIDWPEPFGLVMIEAMACGTPVLAFNEGSVPEVIDEGKSGVIVGSVPEAAQAFPELMAIDRKAVRRAFEERFTVARMADDYVALYRKLLTAGVNGKRTPRAAGASPEIRALHAREA
ncbi:MAG: glycosyltransferase family 4 protein [Xanthobacteraceae bacterium]|nr:glycosyltransferase family 4 protein [Xanthobacteraceae bacterium]MCW5676534.1 glycosyltransferase family 4 protein [Xanthobacteraceae bacterium]